METQDKSPLNLNTVLLTIVLLLSAWTLAKVSALGESHAEIKQQVRSLERAVFKL
jgi:hypothetical protein